MRAMSCVRHANVAGENTIVGGMKTDTAGTTIVIGMITITTAIDS